MADQYQQQTFATTNATDDNPTYYPDAYPEMQQKTMDSLVTSQNGFNEGMAGMPGEEGTDELTVIAEGSVLKDLSGNIVGTLNEDGTYSILDNFAVTQVSEDQEALLQTFENQMSSADANPSQSTDNFQHNVVKTEPNESSNAANVNFDSNISTGKDNFTNSNGTSSVDKFPVKAVATKEPISATSSVSKGTEQKQSDSKPAPLGSSKNPIRIIQQGNTFTSTQQLSEEQLSQIMQVVQQQHALKEAQDGGSKTIYNSKTQTKIVYKVVNPASGGTKITFQEEKTTEAYPKFGRKRGASRFDVEELDEDEELAITAELAKRRAKTRSGRVSKPPKHLLESQDSDEDSEFQGQSDDDDKPAKRRRIDDEDAPDPRPVFKCACCDKIYHGRRWLDSHYEQYPSHRPEGGDDFEDDEPEKKHLWNRNSKRYKLREMMVKCQDEVLLDVMLPKLCSMVTVWEFLLMKIEDEHPDSDVTFPMIYREFENLRVKVKQAFDENMKEKLLRPVAELGSGDSQAESSSPLFNISNKESALALGTTPGQFQVYDKTTMKPDYTYLTNTPSTPQLKNAPSNSNRTVQGIERSELIENRGKPKIVVKDQKDNIKKERIEVVSFPKDKAPAPKYKSAGQLSDKAERQIDLRITDRDIGVAKSSDSSTFTPEISVSFTDSLSRGRNEKQRSVIKTSQLDGDSRKAREMATSVISEKAKAATGVVSDVSDLDVWSKSKGGHSQATGRTPPRTVAIEKGSNDKMVSILGLNSISDGSQAVAASSAASADAAASAPIGEATGEEQIQMVIQHPDGSYQIIEGDEAAKLMQQAADGGATFMEEPTQEQTQMFQSAVEGAQQPAAESVPSDDIGESGDSSKAATQPDNAELAAPAEEEEEAAPEEQHLTETDLLQLAQQAEEQFNAEKVEQEPPAADPVPQAADEPAAMLASNTEPTVAADASLLEQAETVDQQQLLAADSGSIQAAVDDSTQQQQNIDPNSQTLVFQTDDGLILIRQPDGNFQVQSTTGAPINMDTVRALISSLQFT